MDRLQREVSDLRSDVRAVRVENDELRVKIGGVQEQLRSEKLRGTRLTGRVRTLEDLLKKHNITYPADDAEGDPVA